MTMDEFLVLGIAQYLNLFASLHGLLISSHHRMAQVQEIIFPQVQKNVRYDIFMSIWKKQHEKDYYYIHDLFLPLRFNFRDYRFCMRARLGISLLTAALKSGRNIEEKWPAIFFAVRERNDVLHSQSFFQLRTRSVRENGNSSADVERSRLVDISKYLLSVLLPVSSPSYGLNLVSSAFKTLSFLKSFQTEVYSRIKLSAYIRIELKSHARSNRHQTSLYVVYCRITGSIISIEEVAPTI